MSKKDNSDKAHNKINKIEKAREQLEQGHNQGFVNEKKLNQKLSQLDKAEKVVKAAYGTSEHRNNVISVRLNNETLQCIDDLVSANIAQSRSDAASRLIMEGIKNHASLFEQIRKNTEEIEKIRQQLQQSIKDSGLVEASSIED